VYYSPTALAFRPIGGRLDTDEALDGVLGVDTWRTGELSAERRPFITSNARFEPTITAAIARVGSSKQRWSKL
jgi:hypothetical protein